MLKGMEISFFLFISACELHILLIELSGSLAETGNHMPEEIYNRNWQWSKSTSCLLKKNLSNWDQFGNQKRLPWIGGILHIPCWKETTIYQFCFSEKKKKKLFQSLPREAWTSLPLILRKGKLFEIPILILAFVPDLEPLAECTRTGS